MTRGSLLIPPITIHLRFRELSNCDGLSYHPPPFFFSFLIPRHSDLGIPPSLTGGSFKAIPLDNSLMLVSLIDESVAEAPSGVLRN